MPKIHSSRNSFEPENFEIWKELTTTLSPFFHFLFRTPWYYTCLWVLYTPCKRNWNAQCRDEYIVEDQWPVFVIDSIPGVDFDRIKAQHAANRPAYVLKNVTDFRITQSTGISDIKLNKAKKREFWDVKIVVAYSYQVRVRKFIKEEWIVLQCIPCLGSGIALSRSGKSGNYFN